MQCYQTLAAVTLVANTLDSLPGAHRRLPYAVIADWMEQNDIVPEDILFAGEEAVLAKVDRLITGNLAQSLKGSVIPQHPLYQVTYAA